MAVQFTVVCALIACVNAKPGLLHSPLVAPAAVIAAPAPAVVTATSSQVVARNFNGIAAAPIITAAPVPDAPLTAPLAAPAFVHPVAAPVIAKYSAVPVAAPLTAPLVTKYAAPHLAAPLAYRAPLGYAAAPAPLLV